MRVYYAVLMLTSSCFGLLDHEPHHSSVHAENRNAEMYDTENASRDNLNTPQLSLTERLITNDTLPSSKPRTHPQRPKMRLSLAAIILFAATALAIGAPASGEGELFKRVSSNRNLYNADFYYLSCIFFRVTH